jgi:hypothetical protein
MTKAAALARYEEERRRTLVQHAAAVAEWKRQVRLLDESERLNLDGRLRGLGFSIPLRRPREL